MRIANANIRIRIRIRKNFNYSHSREYLKNCECEYFDIDKKFEQKQQISQNLTVNEEILPGLKITHSGRKLIRQPNRNGGNCY